MMVSRGCRRNTTWRCPRRSQRLLRRWRRERETPSVREGRCGEARQMMRRHARSSTLLETAQLLARPPMRPAPPVPSRSTPYARVVSFSQSVLCARERRLGPSYSLLPSAD